MMRKLLPVAALMSTSALLLLPGTSVGQTDQQSSEPCAMLTSYLEENQGYDFPVTLEEARTLQEEQNQQACRTSLEEINASLENQAEQEQQAQSGEAAEGAEIVVEQRAPSIMVDQTAPEVTVQQPQPQVTVSQGQPEIIVRQPAPTVTVDIPQPEIIVRMPEPDVQVSQAQPEVQVEQQQPTVRVVEQGEPQVDVQSAEAEVMLQQHEQQASVQVEQSGEPNIRYEREEPRVQVNQAEGEPQITFEQASRDQREGDETAQQAQPQQDEEQVAQQGQQPETAAAGAQQALSDISVDELLGRTIYGRNDEAVGDVGDVLLAQSGEIEAVIVDVGGFLGIGERPVALRVDELDIQRREGGELLLRLNATQEELENLPAYEEQ